MRKSYNINFTDGKVVAGDNDKAGKTNQERRAYVESNKNRYGSIGKVPENSTFEPAHEVVG